MAWGSPAGPHRDLPVRRARHDAAGKERQSNHARGQRRGQEIQRAGRRGGEERRRDYFTDTFYGLRSNTAANKGIDFMGIFMIKDGKVSLVVNDVPNTNGLAFSPDEKYLYVNGSQDRYIKRYDVQPDDTVTNGQMLIDLKTDKAPGITDGMRVDAKGNIWTSGPGGIWVISPEGKHLGTILLPETAANVSFGDADWKSLYIAARGTIYRSAHCPKASRARPAPRGSRR